MRPLDILKRQSEENIRKNSNDYKMSGPLTMETFSLTTEEEKKVQSVLHMGSNLVLSLTTKRPGLVRRVIIKWLFGWRWVNYAKEEKEAVEGKEPDAYGSVGPRTYIPKLTLGRDVRTIRTKPQEGGGL